MSQRELVAGGGVLRKKESTPRACLLLLPASAPHSWRLRVPGTVQVLGGGQRARGQLMLQVKVKVGEEALRGGPGGGPSVQGPGGDACFPLIL